MVGYCFICVLGGDMEVGNLSKGSTAKEDYPHCICSGIDFNPIVGDLPSILLSGEQDDSDTILITEKFDKPQSIWAVGKMILSYW